ncbi:hypothetical protein ACFFLS_06240 [Flavobacterium procerum]|uniref:Uncharacterized protein n=2 Tax=Flavobacterium procerum TaxID=1455569 RepID=A0ABV6BMF6_9FLAO
MKYLLKGWANEEYNDYHFFIEDVSKDGLIVEYNTRITKFNKTVLEDEILYAVTATTYDNAVKGMIAFCNQQNINFHQIVLGRVLTKPYVANDFEYYAK